MSMLGVQIMAYSISRRNEDLVASYLESVDQADRYWGARGLLYSTLALDDGMAPVPVPEALIAPLEVGPEPIGGMAGHEVGQQGPPDLGG